MRVVCTCVSVCCVCELQVLLTSPVSVPDSAVSIEAMHVSHKFMTQPQLKDALTEHVWNSLLTQLPRLVGTLLCPLASVECV